MILMEDIIKQEIAKNGNTNLISDSGLKSQIFAIGDSHSIFFYNSLKIKEHWGGQSKIPLTVYTLLRDGIDIYNVGNILGNGHENYNIKENDFVIFYYGYNDIQKNINLHAKNNWENEIKKLFINYVKYIIELSSKYKIIPIISCVYPNPRPLAKGVNSHGSNNEKNLYTLEANKVLQEECLRSNIRFLNIYSYITDDYNFIKEELTVDHIHLDYNNKNLREYVENEIYKLF